MKNCIHIKTPSRFFYLFFLGRFCHCPTDQEHKDFQFQARKHLLVKRQPWKAELRSQVEHPRPVPAARNAPAAAAVSAPRPFPGAPGGRCGRAWGAARAGQAEPPPWGSGSTRRTKCERGARGRARGAGLCGAVSVLCSVTPLSRRYITCAEYTQFYGGKKAGKGEGDGPLPQSPGPSPQPRARGAARNGRLCARSASPPSAGTLPAAGAEPEL